MSDPIGNLLNGLGQFLAGFFPGSKHQKYVHVPSKCIGDFKAGHDQVLYTIPYSYAQVLGVIGDFQDLTWSGNPRNTVKLNGTDNVPGTARFYSLAGIDVVETLSEYTAPIVALAAAAAFPEAPTLAPWVEIHTTAQINVPGSPLSAYIPFDGNMAYPTCNGMATVLNMTSHFCATNVPQAKGLLHSLHLQDAVNVGTILGGDVFTNCSALAGTYGMQGLTPRDSSTASGPVHAAALLASLKFRR